MIADCYNLQSAGDIPAAIRDLKGFWKLWSACLLQSVSLPTLRGIIVTRDYHALGRDLHGFLRSIDASSALIRHDMHNEKPSYPRGGFLVREQLLPKILDFFFRLNRIVAVYEPADRLLNGYNLNVLFNDATSACVEVVGPGFDASDLQRGDITPHEVFSIVLSTNGKIARSECTHRVNKEAYQESKRLRREKIRQRMQGSPTPKLAHEMRGGLEVSETTEEHLKAVGSPLCLVEEYTPISKMVITETVRAIVNSQVIDLFQGEAQVGFPLNFSTSFIDRGKRQVFWDIVSPSLKFQGMTYSGKLASQPASFTRIAGD